MTFEPSQSSHADTAQEQPFTQSLPWVALVSMAFLLIFLDRAMFGPLLPAIEKEFGISHAASTRFLLYLAVGYSVSMFLSGYSSSRIRPKVMVGASLIMSGFVLLTISMTANPTLLAFLFIALGLAAGQYLNG
jgi:sugar phosphate permease